MVRTRAGVPSGVWLLCALVAAAAAGTWLLVRSLESALPVDSDLADTDQSPSRAARTRIRTAPDPAAAAMRWWERAEAQAIADLNKGSWFVALSRITAPEASAHLRLVRASSLRALEEEILRESVRGANPERGIASVMAWSRRLRDDPASDPEFVDEAKRALEWAAGMALRPYGSDRMVFTKAYREVRFGTGDLDDAGRTPVRMFRFAEAAAMLRRAQPRLATWYYERRLVAKCRELDEMEADWTLFVGDLRAAVERGDDIEVTDPDPAGTGEPAVFDRAEPPDRSGYTLRIGSGAGVRIRRFTWGKPTPGRTGTAVVVPSLPFVQPALVPAVARIFAEAGEDEVAVKCLDAAGAAYALGSAPVRREVDALRGLLQITGRSVPRYVRWIPALESWIQFAGGTDVAHTIEGLGERDLGSFDDATIDSFLTGGIPWAPAQWDAAAVRFARTAQVERGGRLGHETRSDHFIVFTDVSPRFAAEASLVLDAAYEQVAVVLGLTPEENQSAVVFAREADYRAIAQDRSGGHWSPSERTIRCYLDDPVQRDFSTFHYPILIHEAAHAALGTSTPGDVPSWMDEGIACYFERWEPWRSTSANLRASGASLRRLRNLRIEGDPLPPISSLFRLRYEWDEDGFGPQTLRRYAMAESLFVHLMTDPVRRTFVDRFIVALREREDPAAALTKAEIAALDASWEGFVGTSASPR